MDLEQLSVIITANDRDLRRSLRNINRQLSNTDRQTTQTTNNMSNSFNRLGKTMSGAFAIAGLTAFVNKCTTLASDLQEVQNVVELAFPNMTEQVNAFASNSINAFGMSETSAKKMTGTFGLMAKNFGFTEQEAYNMGASLTSLAGDVASLYNISQDEAFTKLKSVFTGETETLKELGVVMTENALNSWMMQRGINGNISAMTESEKVALRYQFVLSQLGVAQGDFARTSGSWANQVRILKENFAQLLSTIGSGFISLLTPVVKVVNTIISYLNVLAKAIASIFGKLFGKSKSGTGGSSGGGSALGGVATDVGNIGGAAGGVGKTSDAVGGLSDNLGSASKKAKELGKNLMGIDEVHNISPKDDGGSGSGSGGSGGGAGGGGGIDTSGIDSLGDFSVPEFDTSSIDKSVDEMIDKISKIIEPFKQIWNQMKQIIKPNLNYMKEQFKGFIQAIIDWCKGFWNNGGKELLISIALLTGAFLSFGFALTGTVFQALKGLINHLNPVTNAFSRDFIEALTNVIQNITDFVTRATGIGKILLDSGLQDVINTLGDIAMILGTIILDTINDVITSVNDFTNSWFATTVIPILLQVIIVPLRLLLLAVKALLLGLQQIQPVLKVVLSIILAYVAINKVADILDAFDDGLFNLSTKLGTLAGKMQLNANLLSNTLSNAFKNATSHLKDFFYNIGSIGKGIKNLINMFKALTKEMIKQAAQLAKNIALWIKEKVSIIASTVAQKASAIASGLMTAAQWLLNVAMNACPIILLITLIAGLIAIIIKVCDKLGIWTKVTDALSKAWDWLKDKILYLWEAFKTGIKVVLDKFPFIKTIIDSIKKAFGWLIDTVGKAFDKVKSFFGFGDDAEEAGESVDELDESVDGLGESFDETEQPITDATQRISTFADTAKEKLNSINFDGSGLVNQFDEALTIIEERLGMLSGKTQEYLDALVSGDKEKLDKMKENEGSYMEEIKTMYADFDESQQLAFLSKYGIMQGVNDNILNYEGLTLDQRLARANAYNLSILENENLTYAEKQRLMDENLTNAQASYDQDVANLESSIESKKARLASLQGSYYADTEAGKAESERLKQEIQADEEELQKIYGETSDAKIESAEEANEAVKDTNSDANKTEKESYKELEKSSKDALKNIQKELETTKSKINTFKSDVNNKLKDAFKDVAKACKTEMDKVQKYLDELSLEAEIKLKAKVPVFTLEGKLDAEKGTVPKVKVDSYKYLAKGGIVDGATRAIIGEDGKEAVVPLEHNTEWMDIIANRLTGGVFQAVTTAITASNNNNNNNKVASGDVYLDKDKVGKIIYDDMEKERKRRGTKISN